MAPRRCQHCQTAPVLWYSRSVDSASVTNDLRLRLAAHEWAPGERIDPFRLIQQRYGIRGVSGVQNALAPLIQEGLLEGRQGRGTYVVRWPDPTPEPTSAEQARDQIDQALVELARLRHALSTSRDHLARLAAGDDADHKREERVQVRVQEDDGRWAIRGMNQPWWSVQTHTEEAVPILVEDDWFGPGWHEVTLHPGTPVRA